MVIEKERKLSYLMSLGHWEGALLKETKNFSAVYIGKYKRNLLFETNKLFGKDELAEKQVDFKIFLPSFLVSGSGKCVKTAEIEGLRNELIVRFLLDPDKMRIRQQRRYKRLPVLEKARFELEHQQVNVIIKDLSLQGIGLYTTERFRGESGVLRFLNQDLILNVHKVHEFTDFNLFQYGMKLNSEQNTDQLKAYLLMVHEKISAMNLVL